MSTKISLIKGLYPILDTSIVPIPKLKETASEIIKGQLPITPIKSRRTIKQRTPYPVTKLERYYCKKRESLL